MSTATSASQPRVNTKYERLKESLKTQIRQGRYKVGDRLPSETDLARELDISRHTILKGLSELAAEGWIERHQGRGTFVAKRFRHQPIGQQTVVLICSDQGDAMVSGLMRGVGRSLRAHRRELLVLDSEHDAEREAELLESLIDRGVGGAILWSMDPQKNAGLIRHLTDQQVPLVLVDRGFEDMPVPLVCTDHEAGAYEVTRHLIELGHERIAHVTFDHRSSSRVAAVAAREQGFLRAMTEAGIESPQRYVQHVDRTLMRWAHEPAVRAMLAYEQTHRMLASDERPTAMFLLNDMFAPSVYRAAENHNIRIPDDLAVAGFNNDPEAWQLPVPMTTYAQPAEQIGFKAGELVQQSIETRKLSSDIVTLPGELIVRHSTAPAGGVL